MKSRESDREKSNGKKAARARASRRIARTRGPLNLSAPVEEAKLHTVSLQNKTIADFYKPLKKPVTLRLDADVIAWFKRDGRRYQTRINKALRGVMEREMRQA